MPEDKTYTKGNAEIDTGELKFDFDYDAGENDDVKFNLFIKNLLVLIRDFYGASSSAVFWFNKFKKSFKLLTTSEDEEWSNYSDRYAIGNDILSKACLKNAGEIYDNVSDLGNDVLTCFKNVSKVRSVLINPIDINGEVLAVVLCESKSESFFGNPNLYSLQVFSTSIVNFIQYYSLKEDFDFQDRLLKKLSLGKICDEAGIIDSVEEVINRYFDVVNLSFVMSNESDLKLYKAKGKSYSNLLSNVLKIEEGSIVHKSVFDKTVLVHKFAGSDESVYRYFKGENLKNDVYFCCLPVLSNKIVIGAVCFETDQDIFQRQKDVSKMLSLLYPFFYYMKIFNLANEELSLLINKRFDLYDKKYFDLRLFSEIDKCRIFNTTALIVVYTFIDNMDTFLRSGTILDDLMRTYINEIKLALNDYDMIFLLENNLIAMIISSENIENVYIELEKVRKAVASKIYSINGKEINFTVSFGLKKYDDIRITKDVFLKEISNLIESAVKEGGNLVKL